MRANYSAIAALLIVLCCVLLKFTGGGIYIIIYLSKQTDMSEINIEIPKSQINLCVVR